MLFDDANIVNIYLKDNEKNRSGNTNYHSKGEGKNCSNDCTFF